jgi:hypothetical protein
VERGRRRREKELDWPKLDANEDWRGNAEEDD